VKKGVKKIFRRGMAKYILEKKIFFIIKYLQQYLLYTASCEVCNKCFWSYNMETHYKAEHVHLPIPECFILDDEEIDNVSQLLFINICYFLFLMFYLTLL